MRSGEDLFFLVALAGDENHVAGLCGLEGKTNCGGAIDFDGVRDAGRLEAGLDLGEDRRGIFRAWIVAGGDDEIAAFARRLTHFGALGTVAIAATAEERDDARAGSGGDLAGERGQIAERVVGVRVVDDHGEWLAGVDGLEAAGNGLERWNSGGEMRERNAARVSGSEGGEKIEDVDFAGQTRT